MQIKLLEEVGLDARRDTIAKQYPIRNNHAGSAVATTLQSPHNLQKQQGGLGGTAIIGEVCEDARFLFSAERRIGEDHLDAITLTDLCQLETQRVPKLDIGRPSRRQTRSTRPSLTDQPAWRSRPAILR